MTPPCFIHTEYGMSERPHSPPILPPPSSTTTTLHSIPSSTVHSSPKETAASPAWPSSTPTTTAFATPLSIIPSTPFPSRSISATSATWARMTAASPSPRPPRTPWGCTPSIRWGRDRTVFYHVFVGVEWRHERERGAAFSGRAECR